MNEDHAFDPRSIKRPDEALLTYYVLLSALTLVAFPIVFLPRWFKYKTLRYELDDEGVSMSWGLLFRKEIYLTYRRIQDIHVTRNLIQRWLGLADVAVQTASGGAGVEMTIEGVREPDKLRDFLYTNMRGARGTVEEETAAVGAEESPHASTKSLTCFDKSAIRCAACESAPAGSEAGREYAQRSRRKLDLWRDLGPARRHGFACRMGRRRCPRNNPTRSPVHPAPGFLRYLKFRFWLLLTIFDGMIVIAWIAIAVASPRRGRAVAHSRARDRRGPRRRRLRRAASTLRHDLVRDVEP